MQNLSVSHYRKFRWKTLLCFRKLLVSKNVSDKTVGGYHDFPYKLFCLTVPKHFVEETFCVSEKFLVSKLSMDKWRRVVSQVFVSFFCLTVPKKLVGESFCVSEKVGCGKNLRIRRGYHYFLLLVFCPTESKIFVGEQVCVSENFGYRNFFLHKRRGVYNDFLSNSVSHSTEKLRSTNLLCFKKNRVSKKLTDIKGTSLFSVDIFWFHSAEKFRAETLR